MFLFFASLITGVVSARRPRIPRIPRIPRPGRGHRNFIEYIPVQLDSDIDEYNDFEEDEDLIIEMNGRGPIRGNYAITLPKVDIEGVSNPISAAIKQKILHISSSRPKTTKRLTPTPTPSSKGGRKDYKQLSLNDDESTEMNAKMPSIQQLKKYVYQYLQTTDHPSTLDPLIAQLKKEIEPEPTPSQSMAKRSMPSFYGTSSRDKSQKKTPTPTPALRRKYSSLKSNEYEEYDEDEEYEILDDEELMEMNARRIRIPRIRPGRGSRNFVPLKKVDSRLLRIDDIDIPAPKLIPTPAPIEKPPYTRMSRISIPSFTGVVRPRRPTKSPTPTPSSRGKYQSLKSNEDEEYDDEDDEFYDDESYYYILE